MYSTVSPFIRLLKRYKIVVPYTPMPTTYWISERVRVGVQWPVEVHTAVSSDPAANIFTVGYTWVDGGQQCIISKYNHNGVLQWHYIDGGGGVNLTTTQNFYECVVVDPVDSSIYAAGRSAVTTNIDATWWPVVAKFDQNGNKVWQHLLTLNTLSPVTTGLGGGVFAGIEVFTHPVHGRVVRVAAQYEGAAGLLDNGRTVFMVDYSTTTGTFIGRKSLVKSTSLDFTDVLARDVATTTSTVWLLANGMSFSPSASYLVSYPIVNETPPYEPAKYKLAMSVGTDGLELFKMSVNKTNSAAFMIGSAYVDGSQETVVVIKHDLSQPATRTGGWARLINITYPGDMHQGMNRMGDICHDERTGDCFILIGETSTYSSVVMRLNGTTGEIIWQREFKRNNQLFGINGIRYDEVTDSIMFTSATYSGDYSGCTLTKIPADGSKLGTFGDFTITTPTYSATLTTVTAEVTTEVAESDLDAFLTTNGYQLEVGPYASTPENTVDTYTDTVTAIP